MGDNATRKKQEESHTPDKKLDAKAQLGTATGILTFEKTKAVKDGTPDGFVFGKKTDAEENPGTTAEAGESATGNENKPAKVLETTEKKPDEMAEGNADVPEANSIKRPDVEKDGAAEEAGNPIKVPGIMISSIT